MMRQNSQERANVPQTKWNLEKGDVIIFDEIILDFRDKWTIQRSKIGVFRYRIWLDFAESNNIDEFICIGYNSFNTY